MTDGFGLLRRHKDRVARCVGEIAQALALAESGQGASVDALVTSLRAAVLRVCDASDRDRRKAEIVLPEYKVEFHSERDDGIVWIMAWVDGRPVSQIKLGR